MSLINRCVSMPNSGANHTNFTQLFGYENKKMEFRNATSLEREHSSLPTICENSQDDKNIRKNVNESRWATTSPSCISSGLCLPPLSKDLSLRSVKNDFILPSLKGRPSTPRPVLLVREKQKISSNSVDIKRQYFCTEDENANTVAQVAKAKESGDCHPLFSVSPDGLERSSPDDEVPKSARISLQRSKTDPETSKRLLKRRQVRSCEIQQLSDRVSLANLSSRKISS